jgi:hypothetical protein
MRVFDRSDAIPCARFLDGLIKQDSRFGLVGFVPERNLDGRAMLIWMNWQMPSWPIWHRFGTKIT